MPACPASIGSVEPCCGTCGDASLSSMVTDSLTLSDIAVVVEVAMVGGEDDDGGGGGGGGGEDCTTTLFMMEFSSSERKDLLLPQQPNQSDIGGAQILHVYDKSYERNSICCFYGMCYCVVVLIIEMITKDLVRVAHPTSEILGFLTREVLVVVG